MAGSIGPSVKNEYETFKKNLSLSVTRHSDDNEFPVVDVHHQLTVDVYNLCCFYKTN